MTAMHTFLADAAAGVVCPLVKWRVLRTRQTGQVGLLRVRHVEVEPVAAASCFVDLERAPDAPTVAFTPLYNHVGAR